MRSTIYIRRSGALGDVILARHILICSILSRKLIFLKILKRALDQLGILEDLIVTYIVHFYNLMWERKV